MSVASFENELVQKARIKTGNPKLTRNKLMAWVADHSPEPPAYLQLAEGEIAVYLDDLAVWCAFKDTSIKKK